MTYPFFAYIARMRYIGRWGLMRNTEPENIPGTLPHGGGAGPRPGGDPPGPVRRRPWTRGG
ncbi:MAG: YfbR-like 5'-deoxynucleotidase [Evtepia sp.]